MTQLTNLQKLELKRQDAKKQLELEKQSFTYDKLQELTGYKKELISVLHKSVAKGTTPSELAYFLTVCNDIGLSPVNKEIWCYKDHNGNVIVFTGRDGFLKKNKENPLYRGMRSSEVCEKDQFELDMIDGKLVHKIGIERGNIVGAYAIVSIEGQKDTIVWLDFNEFNLGQAKWKTAPKMMIKKCAQSHALKEAAGITGIQAEESAYVKNNVVQFDIPHEEIKPPNSEEKAAERLSIMISEAKTKEELEKLFEHCNTIELKEAYDKKLNELI